jgi:hypothetical protein
MAEGYDHAVAVDEVTPEPRGAASVWVRAGRIGFAAVLLAILVVVAGKHFDDLRTVDLHPSPQWLLAAVPFSFAGGALLPLAWRETVAAYGTPLPRATALRVWCLSQAGRFVPGSVALVASRVVLAARVSRRLAGFSLGLEIGLVLVWAAFYATWLPSSRVAGPIRLTVAVAALAFLVALPALLRRGPGTVDRPLMHRAIALYGLNNLATTAGSAFVAVSLHPADPRDLVLVIGAVNLAIIAGMIGITPAGLGVREGAIAVLLGPRFGAGNAAAIAVAMRAWDFAFELLWVGIAITWERRSLRSTGSSP